MHAIVITKPGGPGVLSWQQVPDPVPGPGEVVIDIAAAGVNRADLMQRQGFYPPPPGAPDYPGLECSGQISALGDGVTGWQLGDEVCALLGGGGYAEKVAVPQGQLLPVPDGVSLTDAAGLPEAACTIQGTVYQQAHLDAGEVYLVHGGAGGMGSFAIQLGRADGAVVACTAGTPDKLERCRELGADLVISHRDQDFVATILDFTDGRGADVILDVVGGPYLARNLAALATWGRLVEISVQGGPRAELDLGLLMHKRATICGATLRARPPAEKAAVVAAARQHAWPLLNVGKIGPVIDQVLPMADAAQAHRLFDEGTHVGKILLANSGG
jgi:putative PIG3 family NAD(P)H quinone oxidoreductase